MSFAGVLSQTVRSPGCDVIAAGVSIVSVAAALDHRSARVRDDDVVAPGIAGSRRRDRVRRGRRSTHVSSVLAPLVGQRSGPRGRHREAGGRALADGHVRGLSGDRGRDVDRQDRCGARHRSARVRDDDVVAPGVAGSRRRDRIRRGRRSGDVGPVLAPLVGRWSFARRNDREAGDRALADGHVRGLSVIAGATSTVRIAAVLVTDPHPFVTTTS